MPRLALRLRGVYPEPHVEILRGACAEERSTQNDRNEGLRVTYEKWVNSHV